MKTLILIKILLGIQFLLFGKCRCKKYTIIEAFDHDGESLGIAPNGSTNGTEWEASFDGYYHLSAYFYQVGVGEEVVEFWQPFDCGKGGGAMMGLQIEISVEMVVDTRNADGGDSLQVKLVCADWGGVVGDPICENEDSCPSLVLIGTTQLHSRIEEGNVLSLNTLMSRWAQKTGTVLSDDFIKYYFYDFNMNGDWYAVPLVSDTRILLYNTTTFDRIGLKYPPPTGDWGTPYSSNWNWEKFTKTAIQIKNETGGDGWTMKTCWDEDLKLALMIGSNYRTYLYTTGDLDIKQCALGESFVDAMNRTMVPMFSTGAVGPASGWVPTDNDDFEEWAQLDPLLDPLDSFPSSFSNGAPVFCCKCFDASDVNGMAIEAPGVFGQYANNSEIQLAYVPGKFSFLGGSGLFIPSTTTSREQDLGWDLLTRFVERISDFGEVVQSPPPLESYWSLPPWNQGRWTVTLEQLQASVPAQYPLASFSEFGDIEWYKPFRMMWLEMNYKGVSSDVAVSRACEIIDYLFTPTCTEEEHSHYSCQICEFSDYGYTVSDCGNNQQRTVSFFKKPGNSSSCVGGYETPLSFSTSCDFVKPASTSGTVTITLSTIGLAFCIGCAVAAFIRRDSPVIKAAQFIFCVLFCLGSSTMNIYPQLALGEHSAALCASRQWIIHLTTSLMIYALFLKIHRVYKIFLNKKMKRIKMTNKMLFQRLGMLMVFELFILVIWMLVDPIRTVEYVEEIQLGASSTEEVISISHETCYLNGTFQTIMWVWKVAVVLFGCYLSWETRKIEQKFSEGRHILLAIYNIAFVGAIAALLIMGVTINRERRVLVETIVILWCSVSSVAFVMIPKFHALKLEEHAFVTVGYGNNSAPDPQLRKASRTGVMSPFQQIAQLKKEKEELQIKCDQLQETINKLQPQAHGIKVH